MSEWDEATLAEIIDTQKKTVAEVKKRNQKEPLTSCLIYLDDWSDRPEYLHRSGGLITSLYLRNRHLGLSCWTGSQKMKSVSLTCRINFRWLLIWRLRSSKELETVLQEVSALYSVDMLNQMYDMAIGDADYSFWYVDMTHRQKEDIYVLDPIRKGPDCKRMTRLNRYDGTIIPYASSELAAMLTRLIAQGQTSCIGNDDVAIVRVGSVGLLLVDVAWIVGRRLFELYLPTSDSTMPFGLRWQLQNQGAYTLTQALAGSGYGGGTVTDLSPVSYTHLTLPTNREV